MTVLLMGKQAGVALVVGIATGESCFAGVKR